MPGSRSMTRLGSLEDLANFGKALKDQRLEEERQARLRAEAEKKRLEEAQIFQRHVQDVKPLPQANRASLDSPKPPPIARQRELDDERVLEESISDHMDVERFLETDDKLSYRRSGIGLDALKRLRSGKWVIKSQIDLHGLRTDEARTAVAEFLRDSVKQDHRCVRIIHGKGLGSVGKEPVLKDKVKRWLVQKDEVLAFCQAPPRDGGAGALLVILKAKSN
ncbi:MAG: Smr/MutS family protein [Limnobacter sp.]|uniref:Smr/MutS family protein n=1 Tax=Limnobacter sp. TaxID=2003368 RepID=UPI003919F86D